MGATAEKLLAIDPGDVHVGVARWESRAFVDVGETTPDGIWAVVDEWSPDVIVLERFHLYPWLARTQSFSTMLTSQMIGAVKRVSDMSGIKVIEQQTQVLNFTRRTPYYKRHVAEHGKPASSHAESALLHGLYYLYLGKGA